MPMETLRARKRWIRQGEIASLRDLLCLGGRTSSRAAKPSAASLYQRSAPCHLPVAAPARSASSLRFWRSHMHRRLRRIQSSDCHDAASQNRVIIRDADALLFTSHRGVTFSCYTHEYTIDTSNTDITRARSQCFGGGRGEGTNVTPHAPET